MNNVINEQPLVFERHHAGRIGINLPSCDVPDIDIQDIYPDKLLRQQPAQFPELSEVDVVRHFTALSRRNYGVDNGFYPLGSCTMKYNPKINEDVAQNHGLTNIHPLQDEQSVQGALSIMFELQQYLTEITGMDAVTLQPVAGAHGELTGLKLIRAYHEANNETRTEVIVPDSAHGTNPASAVMCGLKVVVIPSAPDGGVDVNALKSAVSSKTAALMLTNPNTLGLFESRIEEIAQIVHAAGGLLYYDGANANAIMGMVRPGDMGFDVVHLNLHKTFATPHGGGGPGSGPVGVKAPLKPFLPVPLVRQQNGRYHLDYDGPQSIGSVHSFYGNFNVMLKAYAYIRTMGAEGLRQASQDAVLNANYVMAKLREVYDLAYPRVCMHEFVLAGLKQHHDSVHTLDVAKRLLDYGYHPPTIYFPLIVHEALMIEPTETESKQTLDEFIEVMCQIAREAVEQPDLVTGAPRNTVVSRLDEVTAARKPIVRYQAD